MTKAAHELDEIVNSVPVQKYLKALQDAKPLSDSTIPEIHKPALYAVMRLLGDAKTASILYVASSYGLGMKMISEAGYRNIRGIDVDKMAVDFCVSQGLHANVMDAAQTSFPDNSFDIVVSRDFVAPTYWPQERLTTFLNEQHRILKPGGFAVFTTMWPMIPPYHSENLPKITEIEASQFKGSRPIAMSIRLIMPKDTVSVSAGLQADYLTVTYQKSP